MPEGNKNPWKTLAKKEVYDCPWIKLTKYDVINPAKKKSIYSVVNFKNYAIGIVPLDENNHTWLVGQYRYPIQEYTWEIPEGGGPLSEPVLDAAKRELKEEAGIKARRWEKIQEMHLSNSATDEKAFIYLARELEVGKPNPAEEEDLALRKVSLEEAFDMVDNGTINDAISVAAFLRLRVKMATDKEI